MIVEVVSITSSLLSFSYYKYYISLHLKQFKKFLEKTNLKIKKNCDKIYLDDTGYGDLNIFPNFPDLEKEFFIYIILVFPVINVLYSIYLLICIRKVSKC